MGFTNDKVKDLFSEFYEKTLDPNLQKIVEARLKADPELKLEYDQFINSMNWLGELPNSQIEIPFDLNDKISQRIDLHVLEGKQKQPAPWLILVRNFSLAAVAALAVFGAYTSINHRSSIDTGAGIVGNASSNLQFVEANGILRVQYAPSQNTNLTLYSDPSGKVIKTISISKNQHLNAPIVNKNPEATVMRFATDGQTHVLIVAVPGTVLQPTSKGSGNLEDLAKAISSRYRIPVVLQDPDLSLSVNWNLKGDDLLSNVQPVLDGVNYAADKRNGGIIYITKSS